MLKTEARVAPILLSLTVRVSSKRRSSNFLLRTPPAHPQGLHPTIRFRESALIALNPHPHDLVQFTSAIDKSAKPDSAKPSSANLQNQPTYIPPTPKFKLQSLSNPERHSSSALSSSSWRLWRSGERRGIVEAVLSSESLQPRRSHRLLGRGKSTIWTVLMRNHAVE